MTDYAEIAKKVHDAHWDWQKGEACLDCIEVVMRGGSSRTKTQDQNNLMSYLYHAGEISTRLLRPADGVVIGKIMTHLTQLGLIGDLETEVLVKAFTVYLRGEA